MIFGNWRPGGLAAGAALFGYTDALQLRSGETSVHALLLLAGVLLLVLAVWLGLRGKLVTAVICAVVAAARPRLVPADRHGAGRVHHDDAVRHHAAGARAGLAAAADAGGRRAALPAGPGWLRSPRPTGTRLREQAAAVMAPGLRAVLDVHGRRGRPRRRRPGRGGLQRRERGVRRGAVRRVRPGLGAARRRRRPAGRRGLRRRPRRRAHAVRPVPPAALGERRPGPAGRDRQRHPPDDRGAARRLRPRGPGDRADSERASTRSRSSATKRDRQALSDGQIDWVVDAYTRGEVADEQMSALAMAILLNGMDRRRDRPLDRRDDRLGRADGLLDRGARRPPDRRQALHRRRRRQDHPAARPAGGRLRGGRAAAVRARARPHRRHAGQAGVDPRLAGDADPTRRCWPSSATSAP